MKTKQLIGLAGAAVILGALAYVSSNLNNFKTPPEIGKPVLPDLDLSEIQLIELNTISGEKIILKGSDTGWTIASLYEYPADISKIRANLLAVRDMKIGQSASASKVAKADLLDLQDKSGKSLATLRLGDQHSRKTTGPMAMYGAASIPDGRYVSPGGSEKSYLVNEPLSAFTTQPSSWTDTQIADIPSADISGIAIMQGKNAQILTKEDDSWTIAGLGPNEEFDTSKSYQLESALSSLSFNTLADPALSADDLGITTGTVFKAVLKNGESYTASLGSPMPGSSDRYMKIQAAFTPQGTNTTINAGLKAKVDAFNERTSRWNYVIPAYKAGNMIKTRSDLVKEKEQAAEKPEEDKTDL